MDSHHTIVCFKQDQDEWKDIIAKPQLVLQLQSDIHLLLDADVIHKCLQRDRDISVLKIINSVFSTSFIKRVVTLFYWRWNLILDLSTFDCQHWIACYYVELQNHLQWRLWIFSHCGTESYKNELPRRWLGKTKQDLLNRVSKLNLSEMIKRAVMEVKKDFYISTSWSSARVEAESMMGHFLLFTASTAASAPPPPARSPSLSCATLETDHFSLNCQWNSTAVALQL